MSITFLFSTTPTPPSKVAPLLQMNLNRSPLLCVCVRVSLCLSLCASFSVCFSVSSVGHCFLLWLLYFSLCCSNEILIKTNPGEERIHSSITSRSHLITEGSQGRNRRPWRNPASCLAPHGFLSWLLLTAQVQLPRGGTAHGGVSSS